MNATNKILATSNEVKAYLAVIADQMSDYVAHFDNPDIVRVDLTVEQGPRFIKVKNMGTIHSFIDRTNGDVLKPATWRAPAKHARGNINDRDHGRKALDRHGRVRYLIG